ncbi:MAG: hypothetical protein Q9165_002949 [Trypethelium subeluteriae]
MFLCSLRTSLLTAYEGIPEAHHCRLEVLKVASVPERHAEDPEDPGSKLVVLYRYFIEDDNQNSFIQAAAARSREVLKLVNFDGDNIDAVQDVPIERGDEVVGLTIGVLREIIPQRVDEAGWMIGNVEAAFIALRNRFGSLRLLNISLDKKLYGRFPAVMYLRKAAGDPDIAQYPTSLTDMKVEGDLIHLFSNLPVPEWTWRNVSGAPSEGELRESYETFQDEFGGSAKEDTEKQQALHIGFKCGEPKEVYIFKGGGYDSDCIRPRLDSTSETIYPFPLAKLDGFDGTTATSIGPILAISAKGTRIAIAHWKRILVWAIDPGAFLNAFEDPTVDVEELDAIGDSEYMSYCGHSFYEAYERVGTMIVIPPVELPNDSVVRKLGFTEEDTLHGLTARGLVSWDMRAGCAGRQTKRSLDPDIGWDFHKQDT